MEFDTALLAERGARRSLGRPLDTTSANSFTNFGEVFIQFGFGVHDPPPSNIRDILTRTFIVHLADEGGAIGAPSCSVCSCGVKLVVRD
jgi:hypothetical protein